MYILYTHQKTHLIIDKVPESCFIHQQKIITEKREKKRETKYDEYKKSKEERQGGMEGRREGGRDGGKERGREGEREVGTCTCHIY